MAKKKKTNVNKKQDAKIENNTKEIIAISEGVSHVIDISNEFKNKFENIDNINELTKGEIESLKKEIKSMKSKISKFNDLFNALLEDFKFVPMGYHNSNFLKNSKKVK